MKCPVCDSENTKSGKCMNCGFEDIRTEFINAEELEMWKTYVVQPCKYAYLLNSKLKNEIELLKKKIDNSDNGSCKGKSASRSVGRAPSEVQIEKKDGWNYDDPIAHPNYSEGNCNGTKFSISDISAVMTGTDKAVVSFLVKKISKSPASWANEADMFMVRYRVKDVNGVIVLNETKAINGLMPGDVSREKIEFNGIVPGKYSMDIVSFN